MTRSRSNNGDVSQLDHDHALTDDEIKALVRALLQYDRLLAAAIRAGLSENHFNGHKEHAFFVLYYAARTLHEAHGAVTAEMLITNIQAWNEHDYVVLSSMDHDFLFGKNGEDGFIAEAFRPVELNQSQQRAQRTYFEGVLRRFLNVRAIKAELQTLVNSADPESAPVDPVSILDMFQAQAQKIQHLGATVTNAAHMPEFGGAIELPPAATPTGVRWLDEFIGGIRDRDLIGLLGPYSGGKTTMLISATAQIAQMFYNTEQNKVAVFVSYEDEAEKVRPLIWSAFGHIDRNLFGRGVAPWDSLSTSANLKPYDSLLPENRNGQVVLGERERWDAARQWCNDYFHYLDFAASRENSDVGRGGLAEVVVALQQIVENTGKQIGFLAIDYAGLMLERYIAAARNAQSSDYSRYLSLLPNALRQHIANEFNCPILLAHQLAADKSNDPPGKYMHHTNAKGSKGFAENLHSCACIGARDEDSRVSTIHWSKIRAFVPPSAKGLVQISPYYVGVDLVSDDYYVDAMTNRIVRRGDIGSFGGAPAPATQRPLPQVDRYSDVL